MSKFFGGRSDSDSSSDSSSDSEPEIQVDSGLSPTRNSPVKTMNFLQIQKKPTTRVNAAFLFSDDEEDEKRVVRSAKEKRWVALELRNFWEIIEIIIRYAAIYSNIKTIKNCKKTKDFNQMLSSFEDLQKNFEKAKPVIAKEENGITPR